MYVDTRDDDNAEDWDDEKLKEVVEKKHAEADKKNKNKTEIVSFFMTKNHCKNGLTIFF